MVQSAPKLFIVEEDSLLVSHIKNYLEQKVSIEIHCFPDSRAFESSLTKEMAVSPFCLILGNSEKRGVQRDNASLVNRLRLDAFLFDYMVLGEKSRIESQVMHEIKKEAMGFFSKPISLPAVWECVERILSKQLATHRGLRQGRGLSLGYYTSQRTLRVEKPLEEDLFCGMIGRSAAMKAVFKRIEKVASSSSTVLITGPSGTGKELVANALHELSERKNHSRISINCGAIPPDLLESELFGHMKGSFTGAIHNRKGKFELANGGTLFLDEIGDMPLLLQVKLLRVLQTKQIEAVGSSQLKSIDTRIIAATHQDLESKVAQKKFREDLFYRLNVIPIRIPPLKERREDIPILISHFMHKFIRPDKSNMIDFSPEALELLFHYSWPGNIRELENTMERLVILQGGRIIGPEDLPKKIFICENKTFLNHHRFELPEEGIDLKMILTEIEDHLIFQALKRTNGNRNRASKLLRLNRTTLIEKLRKKDLQTQGHTIL